MKRGQLSRTHRNFLAAAIAAVAVLASLTAAPASASTRVGKDPSQLSNWNVISVNTLLADPTKDAREVFLYEGFVDAAMYDAVVGIDGRYRPYHLHAKAPRGASDVAAAVSAAHAVLTYYCPTQQASLDNSYAASLATIPDGQAKTDGIAYGLLAANDIIALRAHDGRYAPIFFTRPPAPGVWRPTPPTFTPMAVPWMGFVTPLLIRSGDQFDPGPPPALTSRRYTRDLLETEAYGSLNSTVRTPDQTATALFFSGNTAVQMVNGLVDQAAVRGLDVADAARMYAAVGMSMADTLIAVWWVKYVYGFWRPITAIQLADTDGNPATTADASWTPLLTTPPYPEYVSGYSGITGDFSQALEDAFGTRHLDLTLMSTAVAGATRHYATGQGMRDDVINARIWLGIHFRTADVRGVRMGQQVADWALARYFQPVHH